MEKNAAVLKQRVVDRSSNEEKDKEEKNISLSDIREVIPAHCFERSYIKSFYYLFRDFLFVFLTYYSQSIISDYCYNHKHYVLFIASWIIYWWIQGAFMTGLWVIAHECGHHAFSPSKFVNDLVGWIVHSALFVPYFSWQYSHKQHHSRTNNLDEDMVHVPRMKHAKKLNQSGDVLKKVNRPIFDRFKRIFNLTVLGWPLYLIFDATGPPKHDIAWTSHFNPFCPMFKNTNMSFWVILSDIGLALVIYVLYNVSKLVGLINVISYYFIPYLMVNFWLVTITFLHHTDWNIKRYQTKNWNWMKGAIGTIDRNYGSFLNFAHHNIGDTHVVHHLFSKMPHYHALEATDAVKKSGILKDLYLETNEKWYISLWKIIGQGRWYVGDENCMIIKQ